MTDRMTTLSSAAIGQNDSVGNPMLTTMLTTIVDDIGSNITNTTYSAPYSIPTTISIIILSLSASIVTASGNILVIASFCFYRNLRTINNYLILNLAIADLIIGVYSMNVYTIYVIQVSFEISLSFRFNVCRPDLQHVDSLFNFSPVRHIRLITSFFHYIYSLCTCLYQQIYTTQNIFH